MNILKAVIAIALASAAGDRKKSARPVLELRASAAPSWPVPVNRSAVWGIPAPAFFKRNQRKRRRDARRLGRRVAK